jgi:LysR family glycine cleavage system transcriptional activator
MARDIPPFAALRAFEATARRGSLQEAARELSISASGISHQIRALENFVSAKLFVRDAAGLLLTERGRDYLEKIAAGLDLIEAGTSDLRTTEAGHLSLHLFQSLAQLWLIPQLSGFLEANPGVKLNVITKPDVPDLAGSDIDIAIWYGEQAPLAGRSDKLFQEAIRPVCAPSFLQARGPFQRAEDLIGLPLIVCDFHEDEWQTWFEAQEGCPTAPAPQVVVDGRANALEAARAGLGLAMDRRPFGERLLQQGHLVTPFRDSVETVSAYFLVTPTRALSLPLAKRFRLWILELCGQIYRGTAA